MGSSKKVTVGYKYFLGIHMILCHGPIDKLTKIEVDEKTAWEGNATGGQIVVDADELFGGDQREGGVAGAVDVEMGSSTQTKNDYLQSMLGNLIPAYRGVVGVVLRHCYMGLNPYLKRWAFWGQRIHTTAKGEVQWYDEKAAIGQDMNPAHILRECLTDTEWGMGYSSVDVDDASFQAAADTLFVEEMGMSLLWDKSMVLEDFIQLVLRHIDGSCYVDRQTGKFVLKLARADYTIGNLLVLDQSNIERITDFKRGTVDELVNSVTVVYWDASIGKNNSLTVQDIALAAQQQSTIGTTLQFPGFTNGTIASKVAARALKTLSSPLATLTIFANREAASLNVGDVFVLNWPRFGIDQVVFRVSNIELGSLTSNNVKIEAMEDIFGLSEAVYSPPPPSEWSNPSNPPAPCPYHYTVEAPYWELVQQLGQTVAEGLEVGECYVLATGVRPSPDAVNAKLFTNPTGTGYEEAETTDFCPTAVLVSEVVVGQLVIPITSGIDLDIVEAGSYCVINNELMRIDSISNTEMTVGRGILDTVQQLSHAAGSRIFFFDAYAESDGVEYVNGETARIKLLPMTGQGTLNIASAPEQNVIMGERKDRPYPPGRFRLNGQAYPANIEEGAAINVQWAHRDRLQQTASLIDETIGSIGPEVGTTYSVAIYGNGAHLRTETGITGTSYNYTHEMEKADSGGVLHRSIRIRLWSERDGFTSFTEHDFTTIRDGYGVGYGEDYGGIL